MGSSSRSAVNREAFSLSNNSSFNSSSIARSPIGSSESREEARVLLLFARSLVPFRADRRAGADTVPSHRSTTEKMRRKSRPPFPFLLRATQQRAQRLVHRDYHLRTRRFSAFCLTANLSCVRTARAKEGNQGRVTRRSLYLFEDDRGRIEIRALIERTSSGRKDERCAE